MDLLYVKKDAIFVKKFPKEEFKAYLQVIYSKEKDSTAKELLDNIDRYSMITINFDNQMYRSILLIRFENSERDPIKEITISERFHDKVYDKMLEYC